MSDITLITVPFDSGQKNCRMGLGPAILEGFIASQFQDCGYDLIRQTIESDSESLNTEIATAFNLARHLSERVHTAVGCNRFPITFSGNCNAAIGTIGGLGSRVGVIWFDAHGDFNTPETTQSGFLDGMALSIITGRCWRSLASTVPGFIPIADSNVILIGAQHLDTDERGLLTGSGVSQIAPETLTHRMQLDPILSNALLSIGEHTQGIYLHVDIDVFDSRIVMANQWAKPSEVNVAHIQYVAESVSDRLPIVAAGFASYDPSFDTHSKAPSTVFEIAKALLPKTLRIRREKDH